MSHPIISSATRRFQIWGLRRLDWTTAEIAEHLTIRVGTVRNYYRQLNLDTSERVGNTINHKSEPLAVDRILL